MARIDHGVSTKEYNTPESAVQSVLEKWNPKLKTETVSVFESLDRTLAKDYFAQYTMPLGPTSALDGIAVKFEDFSDGIPDTSSWELGKDFIMADTGDDVPDEFDTVIKVEDLDFEDENATNGTSPFKLNPNTPFSIYKAPSEKGENVRAAGNDFFEEDLLVKKDRRITPQRLSCLVAGGIDTVEVYQKPKVAIIPTGNELVEHGDTPKRGEKIESNTALLSSYVISHRAEPKCYPIVNDLVKDLEAVLTDAVKSCDIVILNAGTSKGSEDYAPVVLDEMGEITFHWVNHGPGRPSLGAIVDNTPVLVIPGPPISCDTATHWLLSSALRYMLPSCHIPTVCVYAKASEEMRGSKSMSFWQRVKLIKSDKQEDVYWASKLGRRAPESLGAADGIAIIPKGSIINPGDSIEVRLLAPEEFVDKVSLLSSTRQTI